MQWRKCSTRFLYILPSFRFNFVRSSCRIPLLVNNLIGLLQKFISHSDSLVCSDVLMQNKFDYERIIGALSRFVIRANPNKDHIRNLIIKAAEMELISKPSPAFRSFKDFRNFFKNFTGNHISSIYKLSKPTDTKVLQYWNIPVPNNFVVDLLSLYQRSKLW